MEATTEKPKVVVELNPEDVTFPNVPSEEPKSTLSLDGVDTIVDIENEIQELSVSSCHSEDEDKHIEELVSDVNIEERDESIRVIEGEDEESEEEEEEVSDDYTIHRTTIIPVEREISRETIKMCCICNKIVDQYSHSEDDEEESGSSDKTRPLMSGQNPYTEFPKCGCVSHFTCLIHSRWVRTNESKKSVMCPVCSEPKPKFSLEETREHIRGMKQYKPVVTVGIPDDTEKKKIAASLIELLSETGKLTDAVQYALRVKQDYSGVWDHIKKNGAVKFDDFMKLGWDMSQIYHYVTRDFTELCNRYDFKLEHISHEPTAVGLALNYKVTATDLKTKFPDEFTLKTISDYKMSPISMMALGIDTHQLCLLGMKKDGIRRFKHLSMRDWVKMLNFGKEHLEILGVRKGDFSNPKVLGNTYSNTERGEGVLWSVEGLRDLLELTNEDLVKYMMVDPSDVKKGGKYYQNRRHFSSSGYRRRDERRKPLKQRRRNRKNSVRETAADGILEGIDPNQRIITIPRDRRNGRPRGGRRQTTRPGFAPLSDREKRNIAQLHDIIRDVSDT